MSEKKYIDDRGWKYRVMSGLGENTFKARYQRPEKNGDIGWKGLAAVPWRETREAAQADLDESTHHLAALGLAVGLRRETV